MSTFGQKVDELKRGDKRALLLLVGLAGVGALKEVRPALRPTSRPMPSPQPALLASRAAPAEMSLVSIGATALKLCPSVGVVTSNCLYLAPMAAVHAAVSAGAIGDLNVLPLAVMAVCSVAWFMYSLTTKNIYIMLCAPLGPPPPSPSPLLWASRADCPRGPHPAPCRRPPFRAGVRFPAWWPR